ncbi:hypothetical protein QBC38DRAFT_282055 [Podospora fimiseda]|uniref:Uncharacterized protein n=1 Tax=Podospora fimiseda TaxID=252190 RepID=A0AAN7BKJ8_9PEZI|nr:hypothetical protein QBC38DRAFT_282055 [Podospora fimiseda]
MVAQFQLVVLQRHRLNCLMLIVSFFLFLFDMKYDSHMTYTWQNKSRYLDTFYFSLSACLFIFSKCRTRMSHASKRKKKGNHTPVIHNQRNPQQPKFLLFLSVLPPTHKHRRFRRPPKKKQSPDPKNTPIRRPPNFPSPQ